MDRKIKIMVGEAVLFEIPIDDLEENEQKIIAENLQLAQEMIEKGKPGRAATYVATALLIPNIIKAMEGGE